MSRSSENSVIVGLLTAVTMMGPIRTAALAAEQLLSPANEEVYEALLAEDWAHVATLLQGGPLTGATSVKGRQEVPALPVARLIRGHAYLALNRNNESLDCFLNASSKQDLARWQTWTADLLRRHPDSAVAHYLHGDATARLEHWEQALQDFTNALGLCADHAMALNARGTVYCAAGEWDSALVDLTSATLADEDLVDAHVSLGAMWVQRRAAPSGALRAFERALELSPDYALALNGKACGEYALGHWEQANADLAQAGRTLSHNSRVRLIVDHNLRVLGLAAKRAQFPFFSKLDFVNWPTIRQMVLDPGSVLHPYFHDIPLPEEVDDRVVNRFNEILEIADFYHKHKTEFDRLIAERASAAASEEIAELISETQQVRPGSFAEADADRKLNRFLIELLFPREIIQLAMAGVDSPGFSLERGVGLVDSWSYKQSLPSHELTAGLDRMQNVYRPLADNLEQVPIVGGIGRMWNRHLDNQMGLNQEILRSHGLFVSPSGGVDFNMRRAHVDEGDWGLGTWFGLGYHVESRGRNLARDGS